MRWGPQNDDGLQSLSPLCDLKQYAADVPTGMTPNSQESKSHRIWDPHLIWSIQLKHPAPWEKTICVPGLQKLRS